MRSSRCVTRPAVISASGIATWLSWTPRRGKNGTDRHATVCRVDVQLVASPRLNEPLGVPLASNIAGLRQLVEHVFRGSCCRSAAQDGSIPSLFLRPCGDGRACAWACRPPGASAPASPGPQWPSNPARHDRQARRPASPRPDGRASSPQDATARTRQRLSENVASLGISAHRDQPHSRRSVASVCTLSIRWRVVGRSHTASGMKARAKAHRSSRGRPGEPHA